MKRVQGGLRGYRRPDPAALLRVLRTRRAAAAVLVLGFVFGFAATNLAWPGPRRPLEVGAAPTGPSEPSGSLTPSATPPREWTALELAPLEPIAELAAVDRDAGGVAVGTAFTLTSLAGETVADLAGRLRVSPGIALATSVAADGRSAEVRPASPLLPGAVYRFSLLSPEGLLAGSWAFQAKQPLRVVTTLPADQATSVPLDSGIEVVFDQDGVTDPSSSFEIAPEVRGRFEQHGRTLVFVPSDLEPATIYRVTIRRGVGLSGSDQVLERDVEFSFETQAEGAPSRSSLTFTRHLFETGTREAATLTAWLGLSEGASRRSSRCASIASGASTQLSTAFGRSSAGPNGRCGRTSASFRRRASHASSPST